MMTARLLTLVLLILLLSPLIPTYSIENIVVNSNGREVMYSTTSYTQQIYI